MIKEIKLPEVSDNVETGDVLKVLVNVGDKIEIDQPMIELETEKATFEVPATESGIVKEINVKQGDVIRIGAVILKVETNGTDDNKDKAPSEKNTEDNKNGSAKSENEDASVADSKEESIEDKEEVQKNGNNEEKATGEKKDGNEKKSEGNNKSPVQSAGTKEIKTSSEPAPASPSVRKLARELGVDINSVRGSGAGGRISEDNVKEYVKAKMQSGTSGVSPQKALPDFKKWGEIDIQPMSKIRAITSEVMTYAWTTIPMVTQFDRTDITQLEEFRKKQIRKSEEFSHLTITSILVKVCEEGLKAFPQFNSSIDLSSREIIYKKYINIGVAVDTDRGLLVPVIKNVDKKRISEISVELNELAEKARNKKILPEEMDGGNFTISNLGGIGGTNFTPIVYSPQVAILGVSRGSTEPKFINDSFEPRFMLPLTLTYDHRIIDGADAARFLRWICDAMENPLAMFL